MSVLFVAYLRVPRPWEFVRLLWVSLCIFISDQNLYTVEGKGYRPLYYLIFATLYPMDRKKRKQSYLFCFSSEFCFWRGTQLGIPFAQLDISILRNLIFPFAQLDIFPFAQPDISIRAFISQS